MLGYVIILGLLIGTGYWIISPLLKGGNRKTASSAETEDMLQTLKGKKEAVYVTIRELEFDVKMGKLSDEDFQLLKQQYLAEAVGYMRRMDQVNRMKAKISDPLDSGRKQHGDRNAWTAHMDDSAEKKQIYCTHCGRPTSVKSRFCPGCGSQLDRSRTEHGTRTPDAIQGG